MPRLKAVDHQQRRHQTCFGGVWANFSGMVIQTLLGSLSNELLPHTDLCLRAPSTVQPRSAGETGRRGCRLASRSSGFTFDPLVLDADHVAALASDRPLLRPDPDPHHHHHHHASTPWFRRAGHERGCAVGVDVPGCGGLAQGGPALAPLRVRRPEEARRGALRGTDLVMTCRIGIGALNH